MPDIKDEIIAELDENDLKQFQDSMFLYELLGEDTVKKIIRYAGGLRFSVPNIKSITPLIKRYIDKNYHKYDSSTIKKMALALNMNEQTLRQIYNEVKAERFEKKHQTKLFSE